MDYSIYHNKCNIGKLLHLSFSLLTFFNRDNCPKEHQKGDKQRYVSHAQRMSKISHVHAPLNTKTD